MAEGGGAAVSEGSLTRCIWLLRRQLGDDIKEPRFIETVATVGYRLVCKVEVSDEGSGNLQATGEANRLNEGDFLETPANGEIAVNPLTQIDKPADDRERSRFRSWLLAGAVILIVGLATAIWYLRRPLPPRRLTNPVQLTRDGRRKNVVGTDGNRLYLNILEPKAVGLVPVSGGLITEIPFDLPSQGGLWGVSSVSPDGSSLLALDHFDIFREGARVSIVGTLGHPVRYLTESYAAIFSPAAGPRSIQHPTGPAIP